MAININSNFKVGSPEPLDTRTVLTKAEMISINESAMPSVYYAVCSEDGALYLYNKSNEKTAETGKFRKFEGSNSETPVKGVNGGVFKSDDDTVEDLVIKKHDGGWAIGVTAEEGNGDSITDWDLGNSKNPKIVLGDGRNPNGKNITLVSNGKIQANADDNVSISSGGLINISANDEIDIDAFNNYFNTRSAGLNLESWYYGDEEKKTDLKIAGMKVDSRGWNNISGRHVSIYSDFDIELRPNKYNDVILYGQDDIVLQSTTAGTELYSKSGEMFIGGSGDIMMTPGNTSSYMPHGSANAYIKTGNIKGTLLKNDKKPTITNFSDIHSEQFEIGGKIQLTTDNTDNGEIVINLPKLGEHDTFGVTLTSPSWDEGFSLIENSGSGYVFHGMASGLTSPTDGSITIEADKYINFKTYENAITFTAESNLNLNAGSNVNIAGDEISATVTAIEATTTSDIDITCGGEVTVNAEAIKFESDAETTGSMTARYVRGNQTLHTSSSDYVRDRLNIYGGMNVADNGNTGIAIYSEGKLCTSLKGGMDFNAQGDIVLSAKDGIECDPDIEIYADGEMSLRAKNHIEIATEDDCFIHSNEETWLSSGEAMHIHSADWVELQGNIRIEDGRAHFDPTSFEICGYPSIEVHSDNFVDISFFGKKALRSMGPKQNTSHWQSQFPLADDGTHSYCAASKAGLLMGTVSTPMSFVSEFFTSFCIRGGTLTWAKVAQIFQNNVFPAPPNTGDSVTCMGYLILNGSGSSGAKGIRGITYTGSGYSVQYFSNMYNEYDDNNIDSLHITSNTSICPHSFVIITPRVSSNGVCNFAKCD